MSDDIVESGRYAEFMGEDIPEYKNDHCTRPGRIRVMICDDEFRTREALNSLLSTYQSLSSRDITPEIKVIGNAVNGQEAVKMVEECHPDVVLMDVQMPVMDGFEATRRIKSRWPSVKVILLTMYSGQPNQVKVAGADVYLLKGCPSEMLLSAILDI